MLRWTKTSPGWRSKRVVSGTRESEQPSQRICGDWPAEREGKRPGLVVEVRVAQVVLRARRVRGWALRGKEKISISSGESLLNRG